MKNRRRIIGILASMVLAVVGTVALVGFVQNAKDDAVADEALVDVYVVDTLVPKGADPSTIKSSVSLEQVPARLRQPSAITDLEAVGTNVAATDLQPGDQLLETRLAPQTEVAVEDITDRVQVSARLSVERAVGGTLQPGDLVGVHLSFDPFDVEPTADPATTDPAVGAEPANRTPTMSRLEFQHVLVTAVRATNVQAPAEGSDSQVEQVAGLEFVVTLALSPEQAERFVFANEFGKVWLSNDPAGVADDGTRPVTVTNVYAAAAVR